MRVEGGEWRAEDGYLVRVKIAAEMIYVPLFVPLSVCAHRTIILFIPTDTHFYEYHTYNSQGKKFPGIRAHMKRCISDVYKDMDLTCTTFPSDDTVNPVSIIRHFFFSTY